mmetsp:Transcript_24500/g.56451  ORF Transcript_24500/g.56451 Transcript_24500/m.56451 type:complete len:207 (-) Transcript_24500:239-859(-)
MKWMACEDLAEKGGVAVDNIVDCGHIDIYLGMPLSCMQIRIIHDLTDGLKEGQVLSTHASHDTSIEEGGIRICQSAFLVPQAISPTHLVEAIPQEGAAKAVSLFTRHINSVWILCYQATWVLEHFHIKQIRCEHHLMLGMLPHPITEEREPDIVNAQAVVIEGCVHLLKHKLALLLVHLRKSLREGIVKNNALNTFNRHHRGTKSF